jgi:hypothetical protein
MARRKQRYGDVTMKAAWSLSLLGILSGLYLAVAYTVCRPNVSPGYRMYYIERITSDWKTPFRYAAQPEQGIVFAAEGLPTFVKYIYGFSGREAWGRWTDGNLGKKAGIVLDQSISGSICLEMRALPAPSQLNKEITVTFGHQAKKVVFNSPQFSNYFVDFFGPNAADTVELRFPDTVPRSPDGRRLVLAMGYLRIFRESCGVVQSHTGAEASGKPGSAGASAVKLP